MKKNWAVILGIFLSFCLSLPPTFAEQNGKIAIAVYELKAEAVNESLANILSDIMRDAIFQTNKYRMLTREDMKRILDNLAEKQKIQPDCNTSACLLEIAGALGVEQMVTGSIGKLGNTYVINLRLVDAELADTKNTLSETCPCAEDTLITKIREASLKLLNEKIALPTPPPRQIASLPPVSKNAPQPSDLDEMVLVPGGTFMMGDIFGEGQADERPVHEVYIDDFYIDKYEVTQQKYRQVMGENPSYFKNCNKCPVESVNWLQANEYCTKVGKRLPTEAEWEYAARSGGKREKWAGTSNDLSVYAWYLSNSDLKTHGVGQKKPNGLDIYDMSGNVWEWCNDLYDEKYYSNSPKNNPPGSKTGNIRILRGGSLFFGENSTRNTARLGNHSDIGLNSYGFRCVKSK